MTQSVIDLCHSKWNHTPGDGASSDKLDNKAKRACWELTTWLKLWRAPVIPSRPQQTSTSHLLYPNLVPHQPSKRSYESTHDGREWAKACGRPYRLGQERQERQRGVGHRYSANSNSRNKRTGW